MFSSLLVTPSPSSSELGSPSAFSCLISLQGEAFALEFAVIKASHVKRKKKMRIMGTELQGWRSGRAFPWRSKKKLGSKLPNQVLFDLETAWCQMGGNMGMKWRWLFGVSGAQE